MAIGRNVDDHFNKSPTPHFPRSRFDNGIRKRLQTQQHGVLTPFYCDIVYPGDTWQMDMSTFVRADTSFRVPLDDIFLDTYWFFIPFRIIDENFPKILGEGEPEDYSDVSYGFPLFRVTDDGYYKLDTLLGYLGYNQASALFNYGNSEAVPPVPPHWYFGNSSVGDEITAYALASYYKVYNDWFRDENLDPSIPYKDLYDANDFDVINDSDSLLYQLPCLKVNKYHDYFSSGSIAPQKGPAVTIPLGTSAPVGIFATGTGTTSNVANAIPTGQSFTTGTFLNSKGAGTTSGVSGNDVVADLSQAAGTINELRLAFSIQQLYEKRAAFGTRYIEVIRGQWGIEVPDSFFLRPEYLGGSRVTLNNVPVLSTENSDQLGQMAGNSATLSNGGSWTKTFIEYGIVLGVSVTRVKHSYTQGKKKSIFGLKTQLDLYNPVFANIGLQPVYTYELYNDPDNVGDDVVFNYQEPWAYLRAEQDSFAGLFGMLSTNTEIKNKWHYGDYYSEQPYFSADWLKEPDSNVSRTMTGNLIPGATSDGGHQFMFGYYYHPVKTRILPSHSIPASLFSRL